MSATAFSQPKWTFDLFGREEKPPQYEEKLLASEKTDSKKFTIFRHFIHNNVTHYNYYFNANTKITTVVESAILSQQDDYSKLLSYYPYNLENTASQSSELDSVIYKSTAGILIHDLRTDWVDNLYFLIGKSYYYKKDFDTAALTFQFINYNLFPRKKKEEDDRIVGENSRAHSNVLSIADKEKRNIFKRAFTLPPSRNDALIWLAKTFIEQDKYGEASGMINILQHDPNLPKRLKDDLSEITGYWFYKQQNFDSAAVYLEKSLSNINDKEIKTRQYFLLAQLYELSGFFDKASHYYTKAAQKTPNPLLDIFARLNDAKMLRNAGDMVELDNSIATLLKMAKKDKFESYRDIIFHSAGELSLKKPDTSSAVIFFEKSLANNNNNLPYLNKSHLQLGKIAYIQKQYKKAADHYDSLDVAFLDTKEDSAEVANRISALRKIATQIDIIQLEDSLQMLAMLSDKEREIIIKKAIKKSRNESNTNASTEIMQENALSSTFENKSSSSDLFENNNKGEWYFYNNNLKSSGFNEFKSKWGKRENVDNWRRSSASTKNNYILNGGDPFAAGDVPMRSDSTLKIQSTVNYEDLLATVPIKQEQKDKSNLHIGKALIELAHLFELELEDYQQAVFTYDIYLQRFPDSLAGGEIYLGLYHCYTKLNNHVKAIYYKNLLDSFFKDSKYSMMLNNPALLQPDKNNPVAESLYQRIYDLFLEGKYEEALNLKDKADCDFGEHYWTPQLLYIWAIYCTKCTNDHEAIALLSNIVKNYPTSPLKEKAITLISVLNRRVEIEKYLTGLQITRNAQGDLLIVPQEKTIEITKVKDTGVVVKKVEVVESKNSVIVKDSAATILPAIENGVYKWLPEKLHYVVMLLNNVDGIYINEAKNGFVRFNRQYNFSNIVINKDVIDAQKSMLIFSSFGSADASLVYCDKLKKAAPSEISWLQPSKYSFFIISEDNLQLLKSTKDLDGYKMLLNKVYPGKF